jgi:outer membrane lipoprotein-sorting protein
MRLGRLLRTVASLALFGTLAACPHRFPEPQNALRSPEAVLKTMHERVKDVRSLAVEARASVYSDGTARKATMEIALERPASLFFAALAPTGDMLAVLASDGERFVSFERGGKVCVKGCSTPENIGRLIPLPLRGEEAVLVLLGLVPLIDSASLSVSWSTDDGAYVVTARGKKDDLVQRIWVEHGSGLVQRTEIVKGKEPVMEVRYGKVSKVGGTLLPHRLRVKMAQGKTDLQLDYRDVQLNPETLDAKAFRLTCPPGPEVRDLGCHGEQP